MIHSIPTSVVRHLDRVSGLDQFQLATPIWQNSSSLALLPESEFTPNNGGRKTMPVKVIAASAAPVRKLVRTPQVPEIPEVIEALKKMKPTEAIEVTLCKDTETHYSKNRAGKATVPAKMLASALKRKFSSGALPYTAYTADGKTVIVVKEK